MKKAYYTVEAAFVVSICVWLLFALIYGGFYIHDRVILGSVTNEMTSSRFQNGREAVTEEWERNVKHELQRQLFLMQIKEVKGDKGLLDVKMQIHYSLPISLDRIRKIFLGDSKNAVFETARELVKPMEYKWDYDLMKKK